MNVRGIRRVTNIDSPRQILIYTPKRTHYYLNCECSWQGLKEKTNFWESRDNEEEQWKSDQVQSDSNTEITQPRKPVPFRYNSHRIRKIRNKHYDGILITEVAGSIYKVQSERAKNGEEEEIDRDMFQSKLLSVYRQRMNVHSHCPFSAFQVVNPTEYQANEAATDSFQSYSSSLGCIQEERYDQSGDEQQELLYSEQPQDDEYFPSIKSRRDKKYGRVQPSAGLKQRSINMGDDGRFHCPFCDKVFVSGQQLGGHCSRKHPGQSEVYRQKMIKREKYHNFLRKNPTVQKPLVAYRKSRNRD